MLKVTIPNLDINESANRLYLNQIKINYPYCTIVRIMLEKFIISINYGTYEKYYEDEFK